MRRLFLFTCIVALFLIVLPVSAEETTASSSQPAAVTTGSGPVLPDPATINLMQGTNKMNWNSYEWMLYAHSLRDKGNLNAAREAYWKSYQVAKQHQETPHPYNNANLAEIEASMGNYEKANTLFEEACMTDYCDDLELVDRKTAFITKYMPDGPEKTSRLKSLENKAAQLRHDQLIYNATTLPVDLPVILIGIAGSMILFGRSFKKK
jgi:Flp pilus assembly protein TadD